MGEFGTEVKDYHVAVHPEKLDLLVGGAAKGKGYLYYLRWSDCQIMWVKEFPSLDLGIKAVSYDYTKRHLYALGYSNSDRDHEYLIYFSDATVHDSSYRQRAIKIFRGGGSIV